MNSNLINCIIFPGSLNTSSSAARHQPEGFQMQERKRVLILYSLDHPLYKNIVLKLCGFLAAKCGTEVVLDLLDSARLGALGRIQWLDWHREQIENSSDKILLLCSRGVQAKWRAMCGDKQVILREDVHSPVGDMLTPALCLLVPHFIRSASFEKYLVAYFDNVCSEEDVPSPFNIAVRYKLMKQFEELFFRILDIEKHEPGRMNHIEGLSEDVYHQCPSGRALRDAIEAFHAHQLEHPHWFEEESLESSELPADEPHMTKHPDRSHSVADSTQVISHVKTCETETADRLALKGAEQPLMCSSAEFRSYCWGKAASSTASGWWCSRGRSYQENTEGSTSLIQFNDNYGRIPRPNSVTSSETKKRISKWIRIDMAHP